MIPSKVNHIGLVVKDLDAAEAFLTDVFGLEPAGNEINPGVRARFYSAGGITLQIVEDDQRLRGAPIARLDHVCFDVDDIDEVMTAAEAHGAEFVWDEPLTHLGDHRAQYITDSGGLGVVFQLNDRRGSADARQYEPADMDELREKMNR